MRFSFSLKIVVFCHFLDPPWKVVHRYPYHHFLLCFSLCTGHVHLLYLSIITLLSFLILALFLFLFHFLTWTYLFLPPLPPSFLPSSSSSTRHLLFHPSLQEIKKEAKRDGGQASMLRSDLSNGRASPVSDPSVRPGRKGTRTHTHTHT